MFNKGVFDFEDVREVDSDEKFADERIVVYKVHHDVIDVVFTESSDEVLDSPLLEQQVLFLVDVCYGGVAGQQFRSLPKYTAEYLKAIYLKVT